MNRKRLGAGIAFIAIAFAGYAGPAAAADLAYKAKPIEVFDNNPWMVRVRAITVVPDASANLGIAGASVDISKSVMPELDVTYFFTKNVALEVVAAFSPHSVYGTGAIAPLGKLMHTLLLPPVATLQYHFTDFGAFKPYIGVGVNYTWFLDQSLKQPALVTGHISNSVGVVGNVGFDYMIDRHWGLNLDLKYVDMQPNVSFNNGAITGKVKINPWIVGTGVTYKF